jgi:predicted kinase/2'-5' RNA ligase
LIFTCEAAHDPRTMVSVHVLQGLPGSGKTTFARRQFAAATPIVCSADRFLIEPDGAYHFSRERVQVAHERCLRAFVEALQLGAAEHVVVDNTNLTVAEMSPYVALARAYGAMVRVWHLDVAPEVCLARQAHPLPPETFEEMRSQLDTFAAPAWWPVRTTISLVPKVGPERVYLGLALDATDELVQARDELCKELALIARPEFHITVAFLGDVTPAQLEQLADALSPEIEDALGSVLFDGSGAAYAPTSREPMLLERGQTDLAAGHPLVAWWTVARSGALRRLHRATTETVRRLGLAEPQLLAPHVTLGSRAPADRSAADFDMYELEKPASLGAFQTPAAARVDRVHLTASRILPASFIPLRVW